MVQGILQSPCWLQYTGWSWGLPGCVGNMQKALAFPKQFKSLSLSLTEASDCLQTHSLTCPQPPFHLFYCLFFLLPSQTWNKQILTLQTCLVFYTPKEVSQKWHYLIVIKTLQPGHGGMTSISQAGSVFEPGILIVTGGGTQRNWFLSLVVLSPGIQ